MLLVAEQPEKFVDNFSREFEQAFLTLLQRRHGTKRISANIVYNEYIAGGWKDESFLHSRSFLSSLLYAFCLI